VSLYQAIGGLDGCRKLSAAFYGHVADDPVLRPVFPASFHCAIESLALFLAQFLGGPCEYSQQRWSLSLREAHARFKIGARERDAWLKNMDAAMDDLALDASTRDALRWFFERSSASIARLPDSPATMHSEIERRWREHHTLEQTIAAARAGDAERALAMAANLASLFDRDQGALLSLLAIFSAAGQPLLLLYVREKLAADPRLAHARYTYGRTLLHETAGDGSLEIVEHLLALGADPNATDRYGHTPLYSAGNAVKIQHGAEVVRALVRAGANPNLQDRVKRCTALHMAARRGNVEVAEALLECGGSPEIVDIRGDTPLQRAINCRQPAVAALLRARV
jgi:hemoglobin